MDTGTWGADAELGDTERRVFVSARPVIDYGEDGPPVVRRVGYSLASWRAGGGPEISAPEIEGEAPLLAIRDG
ncbi:MAG: hypothetical protein OEV34_01360 [Gammaproteobacteria bacterium]|nr:hypothetical protein [Gammaproteobacteria bacterium]